MYKKYFKRLLDILSAIIGIILLSPIFLILILILIFTNKGKPFFYQRRPGKDGEIFKVMKFKSMNDKKDLNGDLLPYNLRVTKIGLFIRTFSLDELPQLFNVLKGDMSLIGPRPLLIEYLPLYNEIQKQRHLTRPGISGWAQVNGRNAISWKKKFELDVWYVNNINFSTDLKIVLLTIKKVFFKQDINVNPELNMEPFRGEN